ncbi:MAG: DUF1189 family protein [Planctomycetes bacterium]|nr:DUF1189 family protein [Planctomycetota bacterium]
MKRYSIFHPLVLAFFSKSLYQDVGRNWKGVGALYLLLLMVLTWIPLLVQMQLAINGFVEDEAPSVTEQIPPIEIVNGQVSVDAPMPHVIRNPDTNAPVLVIDTTGEITSLADTEAKALLTKNTLWVEHNEFETRSYDLAGVQRFSLNKQIVRQWLEYLKWFPVVLFPLAVIFSFIYRMVLAAICGLVGLAFASMVGARLEYRTLMRLAAIAFTPTIVLSTLFTLFGVTVPYWASICILLTLVYLFFAVWANAEEEESYVPPEDDYVQLQEW